MGDLKKEVSGFLHNIGRAFPLQLVWSSLQIKGNTPILYIFMTPFIENHDISTPDGPTRIGNVDASEIGAIIDKLTRARFSTTQSKTQLPLGLSDNLCFTCAQPANSIFSGMIVQGQHRIRADRNAYVLDRPD